jgi:hypothetical protein
MNVPVFVLRQLSVNSLQFGGLVPIYFSRHQILSRLMMIMPVRLTPLRVGDVVVSDTPQS